MVTRHRAVERHLPYGITQCYLPPDTGECALPYPSQASRHLTYPKGMEGWVDLDVHWVGEPGRRQSPIQIVSTW